MPFKAEWTIEAVKNAPTGATGRCVLKSPITKQVEEHILFAGGGPQGDASARPFLVAACIEWGQS